MEVGKDANHSGKIFGRPCVGPNVVRLLEVFNHSHAWEREMSSTQERPTPLDSTCFAVSFRVFNSHLILRRFLRVVADLV